MSAEAGQFSRWGRGARLTRRVREEPPPGETHMTGSARSPLRHEKVVRHSRRQSSASSAQVSRSRACRPPPGELAGGRRSLAAGTIWAVGVPAGGCIFTATGPGVFRPKRNDRAARSDAVQPGWIAGRTPSGFHHRLLAAALPRATGAPVCPSGQPIHPQRNAVAAYFRKPPLPISAATPLISAERARSLV